jgi:hypothetical protein
MPHFSNGAPIDFPPSPYRSDGIESSLRRHRTGPRLCLGAIVLGRGGCHVLGEGMEQSSFPDNKCLGVLGIIGIHAGIYAFYWLVRRLAPGFPQKAFIGFYLVLMPLGFLVLWTWRDPRVWMVLALAIAGLLVLARNAGHVR